MPVIHFPVRVMLVLALGCGPICACGGNGSTQPDDGQITGRERIGWGQTAPNLDAAKAYEYTIYVDGTGVRLGGHTCEAVSAESFTCSAPLPPLSAGRHTLELTATNVAGESERSAPLVVVVGQFATVGNPSIASADSPDAAASPAVSCSATGRTCFETETVSPDLPGARTVTALPDGRLLVIRNEDRVLAVGSDGGIRSIAVESPCRSPRTPWLSDLAASPEFISDRRVYAAWTCEDRGAPVELLLVSYRELGDSLGEAEVSEPIPVDDARTTLETGPGGSLYFAARQQSRWKLFAISPPDQRQETPTALRRLPSWAALSVSGERLLVLTRGALLIVFPLASNSGASAHSISPGGLTNGGFAHLAVAGSGRNPGDTAWIAHGTDLRRVSLDTGAEAARLRLSGAILAADLDGGDLFALIAPDGEPTKRQLIRLKVP